MPACGCGLTLTRPPTLTLTNAHADGICLRALSFGRVMRLARVASLELRAVACGCVPRTARQWCKCKFNVHGAGVCAGACTDAGTVLQDRVQMRARVRVCVRARVCGCERGVSKARARARALNTIGIAAALAPPLPHRFLKPPNASRSRAESGTGNG